jgi:serine/threonine protein kinase/tetratricopeptide (TPR) repeat protein
MSQHHEMPSSSGMTGGEAPPPTPAAPPSGHPPRIGPYRILSHLGDGGFGTVYLAEQLQPVRRRVALKVIKAGMDSRAVVARFEAEREALVMMDHPGVAKVFDAGVAEDGRPYFAMEHVEGEPISAYCDHHALTPDDRLRLMVRVCHAVQHAHMKGIIHRDLKPGNILVESIDGEPAPKVIDFGVAKALRPFHTHSGIVTEIGQMVGTPEYMPPEQARGAAADVDTRADVYALGAVLYELLTGTPPIESAVLRREGYVAMQRLIEQQVPEVPSRRLSRAGAPPSTAGTSDRRTHARVPRDLDWIVMRCLEKERARRYESVAALARDIERFLSNQPVEAGPPSLTYRAAKFLRRHRLAVAAAAVCLAVGLGALVITSWALSRAITDRAEAQTKATLAEGALQEAEAVTSFITTMLSEADPENLGRDVTVREVLDKAQRDLARRRPAASPARFPEARIRQAIGTTYLGLGLLEQAQTQLEQAIAIREREDGPEALTTIRARFQLAAVLFARSRLDEAESIYRRCLDSWRRLGIEDDEQVFGAMNNLAQIAARLGRNEESIALQRQALIGMRETLGPFHEFTLGVMINVASHLRDTGNLAEAEPLLREALAGWQDHFGAEHPGTLLAMYNLALLDMEAGRLEEAASLSQRVVEVRSRVLGDEHPDTIKARSNLGLVLTRAGDPGAEAVYLIAWEQAGRILGPEHDVTITTALNLLSLYEVSGWPPESHARTEGLAASLRAIASKEGASAADLNAGAWLLLTAQPERVQDPTWALSTATRAVDLERSAQSRGGGGHLWEYLDTLALAFARTGAAASAVEAQREAIALVPDLPGARQYLPEMQERLAEYQAALGR